MKCLKVAILLVSWILTCSLMTHTDKLQRSFISPPDSAKPRVYWWWLFNRVDKAGITRDLEQFRAKGISGVNLICTGGYAGQAPLLGVDFLSSEWRELFRHAVREAKRLKIEIGFNLAGGWTMMGPWVTQDNAMKKVVHTDLTIQGPKKFAGKLGQPETVDGYYHDIWVQAFRLEGAEKKVNPKTIIDLTAKLKADGQLEWDVPPGEWVILRTGYTLTGHPWSKWHAYPEGDTFKGGDGYEIDYLNTASLEDHFDHLGKLVIEEAKKAGGKLDYLWSDSWECGKLTWTQDFQHQFQRFRGYDLKSYMPALAGYTITDTLISKRFLADFDRTIQDCVAENFYGRFNELCHKYGMKVGNEAGGPNDISPQDVLKNLGRCDLPAGEFWVNGHYKSPNGYNSDKHLRLNLKQTASAAHIYGKQQAMAESFTQQEKDRTHWSLGPSDLKPYANDAFCEGINRIMLHQATCQPPSDGKPGYEFCAGQHWTPNITWWEQSNPFFDYLSRCQFMLQQGKFVADICFYLGERPPTLAPPKYLIPSLGPGYDCDYSNAEVLLKRMSVKNHRIVLPDGMSYRLLVLQNCTSTSPEICKQVSRYQKLAVSSVPSTEMSLEVITKLRELVLQGATIVGAPPLSSTGLKDYPNENIQVQKIAREVWGDLDGIKHTERKFGNGRVIWGKTPREVLTADGIKPDFSYPDQAQEPEKFDYIHRTDGDAEIYFVINRTNLKETRDFNFRVSGKQPEICNAVTGKIELAANFRQANGSTQLSLELDRFDSWFIVFRKPIDKHAMGIASHNGVVLKESFDISDMWKVRFDPQWGGPAEADFAKLDNWITRSENGIKFYSGKATYEKSFDLNKEAGNLLKSSQKSERLFLDLGNVKDVAEVRLNGHKLGIVWCAPWRVEITEAVKAKGNRLEIDIINLWANRVVGDLNLPKENRFTKTHDTFRFNMLMPTTPLLDSGLLGPVKIGSTSN